SWLTPRSGATVEQSAFRMVLLPGRTTAWPATAESDGRQVIFWYPEEDRLDAGGGNALDPLDRAGLRYFTVQRRRIVKVNVYSQLFAVAIVVESPRETDAADAALRAAMATVGGHAVVFLADK